eukprot:1157268-Pelagomonas_calceolata.AAC.5
MWTPSSTRKSRAILSASHNWCSAGPLHVPSVMQGVFCCYCVFLLPTCSLWHCGQRHCVQRSGRGVAVAAAAAAAGTCGIPPQTGCGYFAGM